MGSWQHGGTFPGFLDKGDVMIHRPLFGRLACGERVANPTPQSVVHLLNRSRIR